MQFSVTFLTSLVGTTFAAVTATCNRDNCLRAALASNSKPSPSAAAADCASFFKKTVSLCPATSTAYTVVTVTASPVTSTKFATQTSNFALTQTVSTAYTSIFIDLETLSITQEVTSFSTAVIQVTSATTTTVTVTYTGAAKRDAEMPILPIRVTLAGLSKRATSSACIATTISPSSVPAYASACSGISRYSSACSCNGATQLITTLPQQTSTTTRTSTITTTPTAVVTISQVVSLTSVNTVTNSQLVISSQTTFTTLQVTRTDLETITVTSTVQSTATATNVVGVSSGAFILSTQNDDSIDYQPNGQGSNDFTLFVDSQQTYIELQLNSIGQLVTGGGGTYFTRAAGTGNDEVHIGSVATSPTPDAQKLYCTLMNPSAGTGNLKCSVGGFGGAQSVFNQCGTILYISTAAQVGCTVVQLTAQNAG